MRYLLETHTYLWAANLSPRLSRSASDAIELRENELYFSVASLWEIAIKLSIGKLTTKRSFDELAHHVPAEYGIEILPITSAHLSIVSQLPMHHRDPFDRLLVAQCLANDLILLSSDGTLDAYGVERLW